MTLASLASCTPRNLSHNWDAICPTSGILSSRNRMRLFRLHFKCIDYQALKALPRIGAS